MRLFGLAPAAVFHLRRVETYETRHPRVAPRHRHPVQVCQGGLRGFVRMGSGGRAKWVHAHRFELVLAGGRREGLVLDVVLRHLVPKEVGDVDPDAITNSRPLGPVTRHFTRRGSIRSIFRGTDGL